MELSIDIIKNVLNTENPIIKSRAPDGTTTATLYTTTATSTTASCTYRFGTTSATTGQIVTNSVWIKAGTGQYAYMTANTSGQINVVSGTLIGIGGGLSAYNFNTFGTGTPTPTLGTNTTGRTVAFAWVAQTLNMILT